MTHDPYLEVIRAFNRAGVDYIVIGVSGINYYAGASRQIIMTADFDYFLRPDVDNILKALRRLRRLGFDLSTRRGDVRRLDETAAQEWIDHGRTIVASNFYGVTLDLCLAVSGFDFDELDRGIRRFRAGRTSIRVAGLAHLLRMKEIADRPKDRLFLEKYRLILEGKNGGPTAAKPPPARPPRRRSEREGG